MEKSIMNFLNVHRDTSQIGDEVYKLMDWRGKRSCICPFKGASFTQNNLGAVAILEASCTSDCPFFSVIKVDLEGPELQVNIIEDDKVKQTRFVAPEPKYFWKCNYAKIRRELNFIAQELKDKME